VKLQVKQPVYEPDQPDQGDKAQRGQCGAAQPACVLANVGVDYQEKYWLEVVQDWRPGDPLCASSLSLDVRPGNSPVDSK